MYLRLDDWLVPSRIGWMDGWLNVSRVGWLTSRRVGWMDGWLNVSRTGWQTGFIVGSIDVWQNIYRAGWLTGTIDGWMDGWISPGLWWWTRIFYFMIEWVENQEKIYIYHIIMYIVKVQTYFKVSFCKFVDFICHWKFLNILKEIRKI